MDPSWWSQYDTGFQIDVISKHHNIQQNLSHPERKAIDSLRSNPDIIIKEAEKDGDIVIINRSDTSRMLKDNS